MRAKQFTEAALGVSPKREKRPGSRPDRGHEPKARYGVSKEKEDKFHVKLDKLVHGTFGNSPDELEEADKHSLIGKYQRGEELYNKVKSTWKDLGDAQKKGDKEAASKAFKKHERYANLRAPGTFTKVDEGADDRKQNALWAQITAHEKQAKATKNDIKKQHHLKMADELRGKLKTSDNVEEGSDDLDNYDVGGLQGYYSDFHKDLHGFRPRHHSEEEFNNPEKLKELIRGLHKYMDALKKTPEGRAQLKADGWHFDDEPVDEIAGAFPTPSARQQMANNAAASNRAMAAQEAERQRQANAAQAAKLAQNTADVERLNKVSYHGADAPKPSNADWDGDSDFLDLDGTQYSKASRMPISGDVPPDMKLVVTKQGRQVYLWTRRSLKGVQGHYFYPAEKPKTIQESNMKKQEVTKPRNFVAKNAINTGAGAHKDKKKAEKQGDVKHKKQAIPMDEAMEALEAAFREEKAPRALCISSKPDEDLGASQLASCKSQGLRARDGNKSHKLGKSPKSRVKVGGKRIKGNKYGGPLPDWS